MTGMTAVLASPDGKWVLLRNSQLRNWGVPVARWTHSEQAGGPPCGLHVRPCLRWQMVYLTSKPRTVSQLAANAPGRQPSSFTSVDRGGRGRHGAGRPFIRDAVGLQSSTIWLHDAKGERQISLLEGKPPPAVTRTARGFLPDGKGGSAAGRDEQRSRRSVGSGRGSGHSSPGACSNA